ncbi:MAG: hypothetical protein ACFE0O_15900 [Opitutales bacterium]
MPERPNILFLMSDEHRFDVAGFAGDPVVRTPFLDRLAAGGGVNWFRRTAEGWP